MTGSGVAAWLHRTDWVWSLVGGGYLLSYLFWYRESLAALPESLRDPPGEYPPQWPLDFAITGIAGSALVYLGLRRATAPSPGHRERRTRWSYRSTENAMR